MDFFCTSGVGFDAFLEKGGASSEAAMAEYITSFLSGGFAKGGANPAPQDFCCSTLTVHSLMGRNYDWEGAGGLAIIIHAKPQNGYESYSTNWLNFMGFGQGWKPECFANQYMALAAIYSQTMAKNPKILFHAPPPGSIQAHSGILLPASPVESAPHRCANC